MQRLAQDGYTRDDRMKPYYQEDAVTIYQGDCIEIMRELPADSIDAVVTDPPYGIRFTGEAWDGADIAKRQEWGKETSPVPDGVGGPNGGYRSLAAEAGRYDRSLKASVAFVDWCRQHQPPPAQGGSGSVSTPPARVVSAPPGVGGWSASRSRSASSPRGGRVLPWGWVVRPRRHGSRLGVGGVGLVSVRSGVGRRRCGRFYRIPMS